MATAGGLFQLLPQGGRVQGVVLNPAAHPVVGADVTLRGTPFSAVTDAQGHFVLANLPTGPQILQVDGLRASLAWSHDLSSRLDRALPGPSQSAGRT